eukprot:7299808-Prorocentrum_lima.AAC.1
MTSSLVGSEMCIRDRCNRSSDNGTGHAGVDERRVISSTPTRRTPPSPVSYTHLTLPTICSV